MRYQLVKDNKVIVDNIDKAEGFYEKMMGLMFKENMNDKGGLLFETKSIHTHFMRFPIDVVFLSKNHNVVKVIHSMKPWRITGIYFKAKFAIELVGGTVGTSFKVGDKLDMVCIN
jgi:uncharacterized membrane protein (UPF0127 family)